MAPLAITAVADIQTAVFLPFLHIEVDPLGYRVWRGRPGTDLHVYRARVHTLVRSGNSVSSTENEFLYPYPIIVFDPDPLTSPCSP